MHISIFKYNENDSKNECLISNEHIEYLCNEATAKRGQAGTNTKTNTHTSGGRDAWKEQVQDGEGGGRNKGQGQNLLNVWLLAWDQPCSNGNNSTLQNVL